MYSADLVSYLEELSLNNNKAWFDENRKRYDALRAPFLEYVERVIEGVAAFDASVAGLQAKDCVFRINRDIRFSKDKSPYKTYMSAVLSPSKDKVHVGYYFSIGADDTLTVGGGMHQPETPVLKAVRTVIARDGEKLQSILDAPAFKKTFGKLEGDVLKTVPRDYPADHPFADLLRCRSFTVGHQEQASVIRDDRFVSSIVGRFREMRPLVAFMAEAGR